MRTFLKKYLLLPLASLLWHSALPAQEPAGFDCFNNKDKFEMGAMAGVTYYTGDFNPNLTPFKQPRLYGGFMSRYNAAQYFSLRTHLAYAYLAGDAKGMEGFPGDPWEDNWRFQRPMLFFDLLAEFNFMPYDALDLRKKQRFTPLFQIGLGTAFLFPDMRARITSVKSNRAVAILDIPVGFGAKWCLAERLTLSMEWMMRISFNDRLDFYKGVNAVHSPVINNDWIGTFGVSLSYLLKQNRNCPAHYRHKPIIIKKETL
ncbi:MAG: DUF6089 family protein [Prevotellaceae bacterium]|jgi:hypothetical protein|nr:DUF6089 family protein [Prevotellaceae bacterium]